MKLSAPLSFPAVLFYGLLLVYPMVWGFYVANRLEVPEAFTLLYQLGLLWSVAWWLKADSRKRSVKQVYCLGLLVYVGWVILLPYHLLKTRGAKGLLVILFALAVYLAGLVLGAMAYAVFSV